MIYLGDWLLNLLYGPGQLMALLCALVSMLIKWSGHQWLPGVVVWTSEEKGSVHLYHGLVTWLFKGTWAHQSVYMSSSSKVG